MAQRSRAVPPVAVFISFMNDGPHGIGWPKVVEYFIIGSSSEEYIEHSEKLCGTNSTHAPIPPIIEAQVVDSYRNEDPTGHRV